VVGEHVELGVGIVKHLQIAGSVEAEQRTSPVTLVLDTAVRSMRTRHSALFLSLAMIE
jgi:hypothetical protein